MEKTTILVRLERSAKSGHTSAMLNLYPKQESILIKYGCALQRMGSVTDYPNQHKCWIDWRHAVEGTLAYALLQTAAQVHPELLQSNDNVDSPVPPPYTHCGGWEML